MEFSKNKIKKAGKKLIVEPTNEEALEILSAWRSTHEKPLSYAVNYVEKHSKRVLGGNNYILAYRPKRTSSIINKLKRFNENGMQLTTMQDIAGCRLILENIEDLNKMIKALTGKDKIFELRNDYIRSPKEDGYRSVHLIGIFNANEIERPVELQIRTKVQHSWATAVEIVDLFTKQFLKHDQGEENWKNFFIYSSKVLDYFENSFVENINILASNTFDKKSQKNLKKYFNEEIREAFDKVYYYATNFQIHSQFKAFASSLVRTTDIINTQKCKNEYLLLHIFENDENKFQLEYAIFPKDQYSLAEEEYIKKEKIAMNSRYDTIALISTGRIENIREAYPNYFADSRAFSEFINVMVNLSDEYKKSVNVSLINRIDVNVSLINMLDKDFNPLMIDNRL